MSEATRYTHEGAAPLEPPPQSGKDSALPGAAAPLAALHRRQITGVVLFCATAFTLCWLACLPLWMGPGLSDPGLVAICGGIAMFTPAITAILVVRLVERRPWRRPAKRRTAVGAHAPKPLSVFSSLGLVYRGGARHLLGALAIGMLAPVMLLIASQLIAGALGTFDLDLTLRQAVIDLELPNDSPLAQVWLAFGGRVLTAMVLGGAINLVLALGEELGWRGYLMPRLQQLWGLPVAIVAGGVIWGLWHAPLILLGYNYPDVAPVVGLFAMIAACTVMGGFLYLLKVRLHSLWPAALAHGVNNAVSAIIMTSLLLPGMSIDTVNGSALGWPGWIVYGTVVILGFAVFRRRPAAATRTAGE